MKTIQAIIEMPAHTRHKYEYDPFTNKLVLDRIVPLSVPANYGLIPSTLCDDGDPLDIFVLSSRPLIPVSEVSVVLWGGFSCLDQGEQDDKLIGVLLGDDSVDAWKQETITRQIEHYLKNYKKGFEIVNRLSTGQAFEIYQKAGKIYRGVSESSR